MIKRDYYSVRTGKITSDQTVNFDVLIRMFNITYNRLENEGYFQKYFGIDCNDGYISGVLGEDIDAIMFINLRKNNLYPISTNLTHYTEDDFFDIVEFLYDHCSKGISGHFHNWYNCGYHFDEFNDIEGQKYYRELLNPILKNYKDGFEISDSGEILILSDNGLSNLFLADIPTSDEENIKNKIDSAILKFRRFKSTLEDRREAIRELADVLEFLRPTIKNHLNKKDENDLFNIANNFGIRHHNKEQQTEYDKPIWYSWIFYYYLATLHAVLRMKSKE
ncbi:MAG: hypothetical protein WC121_08005 [Candidatus Kapaibacterium sp.]